MCSISVSPNSGIWLPVFEIFKACTDVNAYDCTKGLYEYRKRVIDDWKKIVPSRTGDSNPRQYCALAFRWHAVPTELSYWLSFEFRWPENVPNVQIIMFMCWLRFVVLAISIKTKYFFLSFFFSSLLLRI